MNKINSYRDLIVWQKSIDLVEKIYSLLKSFPDDERFGLISQMKRSSISIPSNIAEGFGLSSKNYVRFLRISRGSLHELETQLMIAIRLNFMKQNAEIENLMGQIGKILTSIINKIQVSNTNPQSLTPNS